MKTRNYHTIWHLIKQFSFRPVSEHLAANFNVFEAFGTESLKLSQNKCHIWGFDLHAHDLDLEYALSFLDPTEHERAERFIFKRDARNFVLRRMLLRLLLSCYLDLKPEEIQLYQNIYGKTLLASTNLPEIQFNQSFSKTISLVALTLHTRIGIDVEKINPFPNQLEIVTRYFSKDEQRAFSKLSPNDREEGFFVGWTRKEAFVKAQGLGLSKGLDFFSVSFDLREPSSLKYIEDNHNDALDWHIVSLRPQTGYVASIAVQNPKVQFLWCF